MAGETRITVVGNLTADPELRFTPSGAAVTNFTVASNERIFKDGEWKDGNALFMRCNAWNRGKRLLAENVAESCERGMTVVVTGTLRQRSFETTAGEKRTVVELDVEACGPDLATRVVHTRKADDKPAAGGGGSAPPPSDDPWG